MRRSFWIVAMAALGAGCGGARSLDAFQDRQLVADLVGLDAPGQGMIVVLLENRSMSNCASLSSEVQVTVNGDPNVTLAPGGCSLTSSDSPMITFGVDLTDTPQTATVVLSDDTARMEVEVQDLIAHYQLTPLKAGFDPDVHFGQPGVNPVSRGEVLSFERAPAIQTALAEGSLQQEHVDAQGKHDWTIFELLPAQDGAQVQVTIPGDIGDGLATLSVMATTHPAITRCEGVAACTSQVMTGLQTDVTVTP
jgi:hypothetical protein